MLCINLLVHTAFGIMVSDTAFLVNILQPPYLIDVLKFIYFIIHKEFIKCLFIIFIGLLSLINNSWLSTAQYIARLVLLVFGGYITWT